MLGGVVFYAIIPTLFLYFLLICYPYVFPNVFFILVVLELKLQ